MECDECGNEAAEQVEVQFTEGSEKRMQLCPDCIEAYEEGALVRKVEAD